MKLSSKYIKKRLIVLLVLINITFIFLIFRIGWIQIVQGDNYTQLANIQQTRDIIVPASRGSIMDRNGKDLVLNIPTYTLWGSPKEIIKNQKSNYLVSQLSSILKLDKKDLKQHLLDQDLSMVKIAQGLSKQKSDEIIKESFNGIWLTESSRRYYPFGGLASHIIGHTTNDNRGLAGIELEYDKYLSGLPGRLIEVTDASGKELPYGFKNYHKPTNGSGINAAVPGYGVGGKTGTADKVIDRRYAEGKVYSSFVALAPIDDPELAVLVIVDEPQGETFGSLTAAPAVHDILRDTLRYLDIKPDF